MLKIRLQRVGKKNAPSYRVVLAEHTAPPQGKFQEILGFYNPRKKEKSFKKERIEHWPSKGAQLSPTVHNLLVNEGILKEPKLKAWRPKKKEKVEEKVEKETKPEEIKKEEAKPEEKPTEKPKEESKEEIKEEVKEVKEEAKVEEPEKKEEEPEEAKKEEKPKEK